MPSALPIPGIPDHLAAAANQLRGERDRYADRVSGSIYNNVYGPTAILFAREADRDRDEFRAIYFDDADGDALTTLVQGRTGIGRVLDTFGQGTCTLQRSSASAGSGTIYEGTRIVLQGTPPLEYAVSADTVIGSGQTALLATVPIQATVTGPGTAARVSAGLSLEDPVYDPLWRPIGLICGDGTTFEAASDYRARVRQQRLDDRNGYIKEMTLVCQAAGAANVVAFASSYGLDAEDFDGDFGLNAIYVADANFASMPQLVNACAIALEGARVLGADLWVGGITQTPLTIAATVNLVDDPGKLPRVPILQSCVQALLAQFRPTAAGYSVQRFALAGAMTAANPNVQTVSFMSPAADVSVSPTSFPAVLPRYTLSPNAIQLTFAGPV